MTVDESTGLSAVKAGKTYYFCSDYCRRKFLGLPPASSANPVTAAYFCPMCEGVTSDIPATCPKCGMALESNMAGLEEDTSELDDMMRRFKVSLSLGLPVFLLAMGPMLVPSLHHWIMPSWSHWIQGILATPVVVWCGRPFFVRAWHSLKSRNFNMFTLIGMGTGTAFAASLIALVIPGILPDSFKTHGEVPLYFESATTIIVLVLFGQVLELRARRRTGSAIRNLLKRAPSSAFLVQNDTEREVSLEEVRVGDILRVKPGGHVPVDGEVLNGRGDIDMSMLTGEAEPIEVETGSTVAAGTINLTGSFLMKAQRIGSETLFARIIQRVAEAQRSRAPIQHLADKVSGYFVPAVGLIALITSLVWLWIGPTPRLPHALLATVAVLIVACPCALGLATPMAVMVGIGRGAREGILIRNAEVLETVKEVDTVVIDKTGTLTEGKPSVTRLVPIASSGGSKTWPEDEILQLAASVEILSEHPVAKAIVQYAHDRHLPLLPVSDFKAEIGAGASGRINGHHVFVGKDNRGIAIRLEGNTIATLTVTDRIRESATVAIKSLHALGLRVVMLTGDRHETASTVARELEIDEVHAEITPEGKQDVLKRLKTEGHCVLMAGDGINDAPALALADVGIAMGTGTDVAMESAGVVLVKGDLRGIARTIRLSRGVMRNIRENLFWAFAYNVVGVTVAAGVLYPLTGLLLNPMLAALAMSFSSVSVVANALRLNHLKV